MLENFLEKSIDIFQKRGIIITETRKQIIQMEDKKMTKKQYTVVAFQHGKEVFRWEVEKIATANVMVKNLCKAAMKEKEDLMFSIYDKNALEIANGEYLKEDNYYYYYDKRNGEFFRVKIKS